MNLKPIRAIMSMGGTITIRLSKGASNPAFWVLVLLIASSAVAIIHLLKW